MAIARLRAAGIARINLDLVYGLPRQTLETLARTLDAALELAPDRFAVFAYAHVPWMKARQRLIDPHEPADGAAIGPRWPISWLNAWSTSGYVQVGLDHYARPSDALATAAHHGRLRRSFQGYVVDDQPSVVGSGCFGDFEPAARLHPERTRSRPATGRSSKPAASPRRAGWNSPHRTGCAPRSSSG